MRANVVLDDEQAPYTLTAKQQSVMDMICDAPTTYIDDTGQVQQHKALEVLLYGKARPAKTFINCCILITRACKEPSRHIIFRESFTSVDRSIIHDTFPKVLELVFPEPVDRVKIRQKPPFGRFLTVQRFGLKASRTTIRCWETSSPLIVSEASEVIMFSNYIKVLTRLAQKNGLRKLMLVDENPHQRFTGLIQV
ncbi:hypothetical protein AGMMS49990_09920 [Endomicrobiia bacterium]|nr:hypothetical protein AGMMS49990_09920 [Endomicrobiia bacterium]